MAQRLAKTKANYLYIQEYLKDKSYPHTVFEKFRGRILNKKKKRKSPVSRLAINDRNRGRNNIVS
jgi:hypothetical protein